MKRSGLAQLSYSLQLVFLKRGVRAPPQTNTRQGHPPRAEPPPCGDCLYLTFGRRKQLRDRLGHHPRRIHSSEMPRMFERFSHWPWPAAQASPRRSPRLDWHSTRALHTVLEDDYFSSALLPSLHPLQPDRAQSSTARIFQGWLFTGA